jgi:hypothetical protein
MSARSLEAISAPGRFRDAAAFHSRGREGRFSGGLRSVSFILPGRPLVVASLTADVCCRRARRGGDSLAPILTEERGRDAIALIEAAERLGVAARGSWLGRHRRQRGGAADRPRGAELAEAASGFPPREVNGPHQAQRPPDEGGPARQARELSPRSTTRRPTPAVGDLRDSVAASTQAWSRLPGGLGRFPAGRLGDRWHWPARPAATSAAACDLPHPELFARPRRRRPA